MDNVPLLSQTSEIYNSVSENAETPQETDEEYERLGKKAPLPTFLSLSSGPILSHLVIALGEILNSIIVSKYLGEEGVAVYGINYIIEFVCVGVGSYLMVATSLRMSYLFGKNLSEKISQYYIDLIRVAIIFGIASPLILMPITKPINRWLGADEHLTKMGVEYMIPITFGSFFNYLYQINMGVIQAEGRATLFALIEVGEFVLQIGSLIILLKYFKASIWGASLAEVISQAIPGTILFILVLCGKISRKPQLSMFFKKFSDETGPGLSCAISSFIDELTYSFPVLLALKYIGESATKIGHYETLMSICSIISKLDEINGGFCYGCCYGFCPAASYAFGAQKYSRIKHLSGHMLWFSTLVSGILSAIIIFFPKQIGLLWSKDDEFLDWAKKILPEVYYTACLHGLICFVPGLLEALQMICDSTLLTFLCSIIPYPLFSTVLFFTKKNDPVRLCMFYVYGDLFSVILCLLAMIRPFKLLHKLQTGGEIHVE